MVGLVVLVLLVAGLLVAVRVSNSRRSVITRPKATSADNKLPAIGMGSAPSGMVGRPYSLKLYGWDLDQADVLTMAGDGVPAGLSLSCVSLPKSTMAFISCDVLGTPTEPGAKQVLFTLSDSQGAQATRSALINVSAHATPTPFPNKLPSIGAHNFPQGRVGVSYSAYVAGQDEDRYDTLSVVADKLPPGLTLGCGPSARSATGKYALVRCQISGVPTQAGSFDILYTVTDNKGGQGSRIYTLTISQ